MRGYLTVPAEDSGRIVVDSRVEIYRDPEPNSHMVYARKEGTEQDLRVRDITVSRLDNGTAPVVIEPRQSHIEIHNQRSSNNVTVECGSDRVELREGEMEVVDEPATIGVGRTTLRMKVRREAVTRKEGVFVEGDVGGDVVTGEKKSVDKSTNVEDAVMNRSKIGTGDDGPTSAEDDVTGRASVDDTAGRKVGKPDDTDTKSYCETHDRMYTGDMCPECVKNESRTKYCIRCGAEIQLAETVCPDCGRHFPDSS